MTLSERIRKSYDDIEREIRRSEDPFEEPLNKLWRSDPLKIAELSGAQANENVIELSVLRWSMRFNWSDKSVICDSEAGGFITRLISLIYLTEAQGVPPCGEFVSYGAIEGGMFYQKNFSETVERDCLELYRSKEAAFLKACEEIGSFNFEERHFDFAYLPRFNIRIKIWPEDEEFDSRLSFQFDRRCTYYLNAFEVKMACVDLLNRISKIAGK